MTRTTPQLRNAAERLLALEGGPAPEAARRVCDQLGRSLGKLLGAAGFSALVSRALAMAQAEVRELAAVRWTEDGALDGLDGVPERGQIVLVANILGLLVTFVGAALTTRLLQDVWPDAAIDALDQGSDR